MSAKWEEDIDRKSRQLAAPIIKERPIGIIPTMGAGFWWFNTPC